MSITSHLCCIAEHSLLLAEPRESAVKMTLLLNYNTQLFLLFQRFMSAMRKHTPVQLSVWCVRFQICAFTYRQQGLKYSRHTEFQKKKKRKPTLIKSLRSHARKGVNLLQHKTAHKYGTISEGDDKAEKQRCICVGGNVNTHFATAYLLNISLFPLDLDSFQSKIKAE